MKVIAKAWKEADLGHFEDWTGDWPEKVDRAVS